MLLWIGCRPLGSQPSQPETLGRSFQPRSHHPSVNGLIQGKIYRNFPVIFALNQSIESDMRNEVSVSVYCLNPITVILGCALDGAWVISTYVLQACLEIGYTDIAAKKINRKSNKNLKFGGMSWKIHVITFYVHLFSNTPSVTNKPEVSGSPIPSQYQTCLRNHGWVWDEIT